MLKPEEECPDKLRLSVRDAGGVRKGVLEVPSNGPGKLRRFSLRLLKIISVCVSGGRWKVCDSPSKARVSAMPYDFAGIVSVIPAVLAESQELFGFHERVWLRCRS